MPRAEGDLRRGRFPGGLPAFWMAAMDLIDKGELGSLIPAERRATGWVIEVVSEGEFLAYALGAPLRKMSNPAASLARVPAAQEGGPR